MQRLALRCTGTHRYAKHAQPWRQALGALDVNRKLVKRLRRAWQLLVPSYEDDEEPPEKLPGIDDWASTLKRTKTSFRLLAKAKDKLKCVPGRWGTPAARCRGALLLAR